MKTLEIKCNKRQEFGKKSTKKLRADGNVPCVLYGGEENIHFFAHENLFRNLIYTHMVHLVKLDVEGKSYKAILKDIQFHPVTDSILHIDFMEVFEDKPTVVGIPIELKGNSVGIRNGGKLRQRRRTLKVRGLIKDLPDVLDIDITDIDIGQSFKVRDLSFDNLEILDPEQAMVVGVVSSRLAAKALAGAPEEAAEGEAAEGEAAEGEAAEGETQAEAPAEQ